MSTTKDYPAWLAGLSEAEESSNSDGTLRRRWVNAKCAEDDAWELFIDRLGEEETDIDKARRRWDSQPALLDAVREYRRLYEALKPSGGWEGVYEEGRAAVVLATGKD